MPRLRDIPFPRAGLNGGVAVTAMVATEAQAREVPGSVARFSVSTLF
ncbi:hypothetical protein SAMN02927924_04516 [Sphingobium faniae]|nr:hypothetical protein SAMN02927924_04516 [Sphingobium faniae]